MKLAALATICALTLLSAHAQQPDSWEGEWGEFHKISSVPAAPAEGATLSITDCSGNTCKISALSQGTSNSHCDADGTLTITSASQATAHLIAFGEEKCSLTLLRSEGTPPSIEAEPGKGDCASYYCTPGASLTQRYAFRSRSQFYGDDEAACFAEPAPSRAAICGSKSLADLQNQWRDLTFEVADLGSPRVDEREEQARLLASCDHSTDAAACLDKAFHASMDQWNERKQSWLNSVTLPGDEAEAAKQSEAINGRYVHSFRNGNVQGDAYRSTDTLNIARLSGDSISYSLELNFFNGHSCSRKGVATYRKGGFFVDKSKGVTAEKTCYFEVIPTENGVKLGDPTGACRETDCGARGGYTDAGFSFHEKVQEFSK
ncbi:hypothetical protein [Silvibacterium acidisoli]|uniref:hypothetical protein n=1 Tax=Acidobacteriaceae bacterium ZG23-2 TaxID=2883246 RepID=UPI00406D46E7